MKNCKKFTLIELLVVVAIIGILVTLLMPSLVNARKKALQAVCASNISQNIKMMHTYASNNNGKVWDCDPRDGYGLTIRRFKSENYDMRQYIAPYTNTGKSFNDLISDDVDDLSTWLCPAINAPAIDNKNNTRSWAYMGLTYFPGNKFPFTQMTHDKILPSWDRLPLNISLLADFVVQQDNTTKIAGVFQFNHGDGETKSLIKNGVELTTNPSFLIKTNSSAKSIDGSLMGYGDGSVIWSPFGALQDVGRFHRSLNNRRLFSLPPR